MGYLIVKRSIGKPVALETCFNQRLLLEKMGKCSSRYDRTADLAVRTADAWFRALRGGAAHGDECGRLEIFLELAVDRRWPIPTILPVAVAVRVHRGYKDAREAI